MVVTAVVERENDTDKIKLTAQMSSSCEDRNGYGAVGIVVDKSDPHWMEV